MQAHVHAHIFTHTHTENIKSKVNTKRDPDSFEWNGTKPDTNNCNNTEDMRHKMGDFCIEINLRVWKEKNVGNRSTRGNQKYITKPLLSTVCDKGDMEN